MAVIVIRKGVKRIVRRTRLVDTNRVHTRVRIINYTTKVPDGVVPRYAEVINSFVYHAYNI